MNPIEKAAAAKLAAAAIVAATWSAVFVGLGVGIYFAPSGEWWNLGYMAAGVYVGGRLAAAWKKYMDQRKFVAWVHNAGGLEAGLKEFGQKLTEAMKAAGTLPADLPPGPAPRADTEGTPDHA